MAMSARLRAGLTAAAALALATAGAGIGLGATAANASPGAPDATITIHAGGDRTSSTTANTNHTAGTVSPLDHVTFSVSGGNLPAAEECTTGEDGASAGECSVTVPGGSGSSGDYTVRRISVPSGWFADDHLGAGLVGPPNTVTSMAYNPFTVHVGVGAHVNAPFAATNNTGLTTRSGVFALSRDNPPLENGCGLRIALLFDLSSSITSPTNFLPEYKRAGVAFVNALRGTDSSVAVFTFGTTAPAPNTMGTNNATLPLTPIADSPTITTKINGLGVPSASYTNWDQGIWQIVQSNSALPASGRYQVAIVLTDGDPTKYGPGGQFGPASPVTVQFAMTENAIFSANALKAQHTEVLAVGFGPTPEHTGSLDDLEAIASPDDVFLTTFSELEAELKALALKNCAGMTLEKSASPPTYDHVDQVITYTYTVTNTKFFTLHDVHVTDDHIRGPISCTPDVLMTGQMATCTAEYTITQEDLDRGFVVNTATAHGVTENGDDVTSPPDQAKVIAQRHPAIKITKSAMPTRFDAPGQTITYTYRVTNTGNVTLHDVTVDDSNLGKIDCPKTTLAPGEMMTCTATHVTTQSNVNAGGIKNVATVTGHPPDGLHPVTDEADDAVIGVRHPAIEITKVARPRNYTAAGQAITYTYTVTNTGNVTLYHVHFTDSTIKGPFSCTPHMPATLEPGESMTCTATYITTQEDVDRGHFQNSATATGTPPYDLKHPSDTAVEEIFRLNRPAIAIAKTSLPHQYNAPGQLLHYTYTVRNTGNVTLHDVTVVDSRLGKIDCPKTTLARGEKMICTATLTVNQDDINEGSVTNIATATGLSPSGVPVRDEAHLTVFADFTAAIDITKSASPQQYDAPGQKITYTYTVRNLGNVPLADVTITDNKIPGPFECVPAMHSTLAPRTSMTCTATLTTTQQDVDNASIANTATVTGHPENGMAITGTAQETIFAVLAPDIEMTESASPLTYSGPDQKISYRFTVTNAGNVTLHGVTVADSELGTIACPKTTLAPSASMTCTATHVTTASDVTDQSIADTATATGRPPDGGQAKSLTTKETVKFV